MPFSTIFRISLGFLVIFLIFSSGGKYIGIGHLFPTPPASALPLSLAIIISSSIITTFQIARYSKKSPGGSRSCKNKPPPGPGIPETSARETALSQSPCGLSNR
jgi:hypothetical protein